MNFAATLEPDWATQGDWLGRYGRQYALLCAAQAPWGDHQVFFGEGYSIRRSLGPHIQGSDSLRSWVHWIRTDNPRCLYDPMIGYRREAEHDDHGEAYAYTWQGPDLWYEVSVPDGVFRATMYVMNKDGHDGDNRYRDYTVEIKRPAKDMGAADAAPALACARIHTFWGGVYQGFLLRGPGVYWMKIGKNGSLNTLCAGLFLDRLSGPMGPLEDLGGPYLGEARYDPPTIPADAPLPPAASSARRLWDALDVGYADLSGERAAYRLLAYRAASAAKAPAPLLEGWRWGLHLWTPSDRAGFGAAARRTYAAMLSKHPALKDAKL